MSSKKAMKLAQKQAFAKHRSKKMLLTVDLLQRK